MYSGEITSALTDGGVDCHLESHAVTCVKLFMPIASV